MEPEPNAREQARAAAIQSCQYECRKLLHKILNLQNNLFQLQINQNPNGAREMDNLIKQIARLKLIMNLFRFCILCIKKPKRFDIFSHLKNLILILMKRMYVPKHYIIFYILI